MDTQNQTKLSSCDGLTIFQFRKHTIRFRAPYSLERYTEVKEWDNGYIVVMAKYAHNPHPEEEKQRLLYYVRYHDDWISVSNKHIQKHLERVPLPAFHRLLHLQIADAEAHVQLPFIETHIRACKVCLAMTGDDYAQILSTPADDEKIDVVATRVLQRFRPAFQALADADLAADPFCSAADIDHIKQGMVALDNEV